MKVVILAAGMGKRLGQNIPKALVEVIENITIMDLQIKNLIQIVDLEDIIVVVGFKGNLIFKKYRDLNFSYNKDYFNTNTAKSLLNGIKQLNEDVLWLNGDIVFEPSILDMMDFNNENMICVNNESVSEEEVKYTIYNNGYINRISKTVVCGLGEAVGINFIKKKDLSKFKSCLELCGNQDYFEKGIEFAIDKGINFLPINIQNKTCIEIDFKEDLNKAKASLIQRKAF